ncbi:MAG: MFS transporter [Candidatus Lokiarchaeota archaeon]|nr:MFS transporter [Candidatus Lokiarchaeota archaeon]
MYNGIKDKIAVRTVLGVNLNIFLLGLTSLFTDWSSEMIGAILPLFILSIGGNIIVIGLIEGISNATSNILKGVSGILADTRKLETNRKGIVAAGYSISNLSKPLIGLFPNWLVTLGLKFTDRIGKGVRTSPRDAMIADYEDKNRGKSFGIHRALDTMGAIFGPLTASILLFLGLTYNIIIIVSIIPGVIAISILLFVKETKKLVKDQKEAGQKPTKKFLKMMIVLGVIEFASIDLAFIIVRASDFVLPAFIPLMIVATNILYVIFAIVAGDLSDKIGRKKMIVAGLIILLSISIMLIFNYPINFFSIMLITIIFIMFGIYMGVVDPVSRAYVADLSGKKKKGTAYGIYYLFIGLISMPESILFGFFYETFSYTFAFTFSSILLVICIIIFLFQDFRIEKE